MRRWNGLIVRRREEKERGRAEKEGVGGNRRVGEKRYKSLAIQNKEISPEKKRERDCERDFTNRVDTITTFLG